MFKKVAKRATALDLETYGRNIGRIVKKPDKLIKSVEKCFSKPGEEAELRRTMAKHVFHDPGNAVQKVLGVVRMAAGLESGLPDGVIHLEPDTGATNELQNQVVES